MSKTTNKYSPEVRERAVRLPKQNEGRHESRWAAMVSIAEKIGCNPETLRGWVRQAERDLDLWAYAKGVTLDFSRPGKPTDNADIESFKGRFRAECLNTHWFLTLCRCR